MKRSNQQEVIHTTKPDVDLNEVPADLLGRLVALIVTLSAEIRRLRARLARTLADLRNLIAAARATLGADADGEADPLYYLRDELQAQGQLPPDESSPSERL